MPVTFKPVRQGDPQFTEIIKSIFPNSIDAINISEDTK